MLSILDSHILSIVSSFIPSIIVLISKFSTSEPKLTSKDVTTLIIFLNSPLTTLPSVSVLSTQLLMFCSINSSSNTKLGIDDKFNNSFSLNVSYKYLDKTHCVIGEDINLSIFVLSSEIVFKIVVIKSSDSKLGISFTISATTSKESNKLSICLILI